MNHSTLIDAPTLQSRLSGTDMILVDVRHDLANLSAGETAYREGHLPGARFAHLDRDLSGTKTGSNGRHPLPDRDVLAGTLGRLGIGNGSQVVVYDGQGGMFASRLWWLLRWMGHARVAVLDGGIGEWTRLGFALEPVLPEVVPVPFVAFDPLVSVASADDVLAGLGSPDHLVVDARSPDRFRGENETMDPVGGRIPGAVNRFFKDNLDGHGRFKTPDRLHGEWSAILDGISPHQVQAQCGSGVTACHNLLALEVAGLPGAVLYSGSWSEWCSDPRRPVERG